MMNSSEKQALFEEAALVLEDRSPPDLSPTHHTAAGKNPTTDNCQAELATAVDGGKGGYMR